MAYKFTLNQECLKRKFSVYVVIAFGKEDIKLYVGKTGDNREGCNPLISRCGNHFSYNKIHSQVRNKKEDKFNFAAKETLNIIMERAEHQLDLFYRQLVSYDQLSAEQITELNALVRLLYPELNNDESIEAYMKNLALSYFRWEAEEAG